MNIIRKEKHVARDKRKKNECRKINAFCLAYKTCEKHGSTNTDKQTQNENDGSFESVIDKAQCCKDCKRHERIFDFFVQFSEFHFYIPNSFAKDAV